MLISWSEERKSYRSSPVLSVLWSLDFELYKLAYLAVFIGSNKQAWAKCETSDGQESNACLLVVANCRKIGYFEWSTPLVLPFRSKILF